MENGILIHFDTIEDPRQRAKIKHPMRNIVFIVLVGVFNRLDGWEEIADFAEYRRDYFEKYLDLSNVLPTDDTLRRFFQNLNPQTFHEHFYKWVSSIAHGTEIAKKIVDAGADDVLGLKGNQPSLLEELKQLKKSKRVVKRHLTHDISSPLTRIKCVNVWQKASASIGELKVCIGS